MPYVTLAAPGKDKIQQVAELLVSLRASVPILAQSLLANAERTDCNGVTRSTDAFDLSKQALRELYGFGEFIIYHGLSLFGQARGCHFYDPACHFVVGNGILGRHFLIFGTDILLIESAAQRPFVRSFSVRMCCSSATSVQDRYLGQGPLQESRAQTLSGAACSNTMHIAERVSCF